MKTKEELNALKEEVETVSRKLHELTEEELEQVSGGSDDIVDFTSKVYETVTTTLKQAEEEKDKLLASIIKQPQPREKRDWDRDKLREHQFDGLK